jgi:hypothetical protein
MLYGHYTKETAIPVSDLFTILKNHARQSNEFKFRYYLYLPN